MQVSSDGKQFIRKHEGMYGKVYADLDSESNKRKGLARWEDAKPYTNKGWPTIGIGHLIYFEGSWNKDERSRFAQYLRDGGEMTEQQMWDLLDEDLAYFEKGIMKKLVKPIPQKSFDALVSMGFNTGLGNKNLREAIRLTNEGQIEAAADAIRGGPTQGSGSTGTLGGLVKRRKEEADRFLNGFQSNSLVGMIGSGPLSKPLFWVTLLGLIGIGSWAYLNWDFVKEKLELK